MEQTSPPLLQKTCVLCVARPHVSSRSNSHHVPHQCLGSRARHGLYNQEVPWLRLHCHDVADAYSHGAAIALRPWSHPAQQCLVLVQHDPRISNGAYPLTFLFQLNLILLRCVLCMFLFRCIDARLLYTLFYRYATTEFLVLSVSYMFFGFFRVIVIPLSLLSTCT